MARLLQAYHISINPSSLSLSNITSFFIFLAGVTGIFSIIMLLCTTYKHTKISKASQPSSPPPQRENKFLSHLSSKALVVVKMVSWKKVEEEEEEEEEDDDVDDQAVWRKAIIMGDKCRPPDFSGQILYDSQGNPLPEPPARSHRRHEMF